MILFYCFLKKIAYTKRWSNNKMTDIIWLFAFSEKLVLELVKIQWCLQEARMQNTAIHPSNQVYFQAYRAGSWGCEWRCYLPCQGRYIETASQPDHKRTKGFLSWNWTLKFITNKLIWFQCHLWKRKLKLPRLFTVCLIPVAWAFKARCQIILYKTIKYS